MATQDNINKFYIAARYDKFDDLKRLVATVSDEELQEMITADKFKAMRLAIEYNKPTVVNYLNDIMTASTRHALVSSNNFFSEFQKAAELGYPDVVDALISLVDQVDPAKVQEMLSYNNFSAFQMATKNERLPVVNRLLNFPSVLEFADEKDVEYGKKHIDYFVTQKVESLRRRASQFLQLSQRDKVFDLSDPEEARLCFYMLRNLIRRYDDLYRYNPKNPDMITLLSDFDFLLTIPAVETLATKAVKPNGQNQLMELAFRAQNCSFLRRLVAISAVKDEVTRYRRYYGNKDDINLSELLNVIGAPVRNMDASTSPVSQHQEKALSRVRSEVSQVIPGIRQQLKNERLLKSATDHPLSDEVTRETLIKEVRDFVYQHFDAAITDTNRAALKAAWKDVLFDKVHLDKSRKVLAQLNIPAASRTAFIERLKEKYGEVLSGNPVFMKLITQTIALNEGETHAEKLAWVGLDRFLNTPSTRGGLNIVARSDQASEGDMTMRPIRRAPQ